MNSDFFSRTGCTRLENYNGETPDLGVRQIEGKSKIAGENRVTFQTANLVAETVEFFLAWRRATLDHRR
jgi:hypothetical protein